MCNEVEVFDLLKRNGFKLAPHLVNIWKNSGTTIFTHWPKLKIPNPCKNLSSTLLVNVSIIKHCQTRKRSCCLAQGFGGLLPVSSFYQENKLRSSLSRVSAHLYWRSRHWSILLQVHPKQMCPWKWHLQDKLSSNFLPPVLAEVLVTARVKTRMKPHQIWKARKWSIILESSTRKHGLILWAKCSTRYDNITNLSMGYLIINLSLVAFCLQRNTPISTSGLAMRSKRVNPDGEMRPFKCDQCPRVRRIIRI